MIKNNNKGIVRSGLSTMVLTAISEIDEFANHWGFYDPLCK